MPPPYFRLYDLSSGREANRSAGFWLLGELAQQLHARCRGYQATNWPARLVAAVPQWASGAHSPYVPRSGSFTVRRICICPSRPAPAESTGDTRARGNGLQETHVYAAAAWANAYVRTHACVLHSQHARGIRVTPSPVQTEAGNRDSQGLLDRKRHSHVTQTPSRGRMAQHNPIFSARQRGAARGSRRA